MTYGNYRAFRFIHPGVEIRGVSDELMAENPRIPDTTPGFAISRSGGLEMVDEHESVWQSIVLLLSTRPGERVMRPEYGCELHRLMFSPNDATTAGLAIHFVRGAIENWERRVEILTLNAERDPAYPSRLLLSLVYKVRATQRVEQFRLSVGLS